MSPRTERFRIDGEPRVFLRLPAGQARIVSGEPGLVKVTMVGRDAILERFQVHLQGDQVVIEPQSGHMGRWSSVTVEIAVGPGADIHARLAAGDVAVTTDIASLTVEAGSGDVTSGPITGDARIKTASGDVTTSDIGGRLEVAAASGDVRVRSVIGDVSAKTASGDIEIGEVGGAVVAHSASGDIDIRRFLGNDFDAKTLSGDVQIGVTDGRTFSVDFSSLSGSVRTDFPVSSGSAPGTTARLAIKSMSGDIVVRPAR